MKKSAQLVEAFMRNEFFIFYAQDIEKSLEDNDFDRFFFITEYQESEYQEHSQKLIT